MNGYPSLTVDNAMMVKNKRKIQDSRAPETKTGAREQGNPVHPE